MSHPEPDLETQKKRHSGPLIGIAVAILIALIAAYALGAFDVNNEGEDPVVETETTG